MAKFIKNICKRSRRAGLCLSLKRRGTDLTLKCNRLSVSPGQHGLKRRKTGDYLLQFRAKQVLKYIYNVFERQFKNYYYNAMKKKGATGFLLLLLLETRLDNIVYRMGFASTRSEARQLVVHKHILVSEKENANLSGVASFCTSFSNLKWHVVNIPSFQVRIGCYVGIKREKMNQKRIKDALLERDKCEKLPYWLSLNVEEVYGKLNEMPKRVDLPSHYNEQLIVELYSK